MAFCKIAARSDNQAVEKTPFEDRMTIFNAYDLLKEGTSVNPDAMAISLILSGELYANPVQATHRELWGKVNQTANLFHDFGVGARDVVSVILPNLHYTHYVLWGGEAAGIAHMVNPLLEPKTIAETCRAAKTKVLVALGEFPGADIWQKVMAIRNELPDLKAIVRIMGPSDEKEGIYGYDDVIHRYPADKLDSKRVIDPGDIASIYGTSGTTGRPKLVARTHYNEAAMMTMMKLWVGDNIRPGEAVLCGLPMFHANATMATGLLPLSLGAHVVLLSPRGYRDANILKNFFKIVEHYQAVTFVGVPTVLSVLLDLPLEGANISSLRFATCGTAPLSVDLFRRFEEHSGMKIIEGYGLTETTLCSTLNPIYGDRKIGSVGLPVPYQEVKIMVNDGRGDREVPVDEIGSIYLRGPNIFPGYLEEKDNQGLWLNGGWLNTGDLGRMDSDGYLWLTGRKKDLIIRGGHNIDPAVIENPLYIHPDVQFAAAVGRPDSHAGEVPVAYVQLREGTHPTKEELLNYLKENVGEKAAVPKEIFIIDSMPLTPIGKVYKPALRRDIIRRVYENDLEALGRDGSSLTVDVVEDQTYGTLAVIRIKPAAHESVEAVKNKIKDILLRYTIKYKVEVE